MIEVLTYADITFRIDSINNHKSRVENLLNSVKEKINTLEINSIGSPKKNIYNGCYEVEFYGKLQLTLTETSSKKKVEEYLHDISPFLLRNLNKCNSVNNLKIIQMKRVLENSDIKEQFTMYNN